jgi:hypothetical protein
MIRLIYYEIHAPTGNKLTEKSEPAIMFPAIVLLLACFLSELFVIKLV